ncbi:MAG: SDR family oxidoreductase [Sphingobium sp.]
MSDKGRTRRSRAIVTGASKGIGAATAERLAGDGAHVLLVGRDEGDLAKRCEGIRRAGGRADFISIDIADRAAAGRIVEAATETLGGIDIVVNCASATLNDHFFALTDDQWQLGFEIKIFGTIRLCRAAWPSLKASGGSIVNIGGIGARTPMARNVMTGALSSSLMAITKALAEAGIAEGVQVNLIHPGFIRTPRSEKTVRRDAGTDDLDAAMQAKVAAMGAIRPGVPADVASLVAWIVSPEGSFLQGAAIDLDGGATRGI